MKQKIFFITILLLSVISTFAQQKYQKVRIYADKQETQILQKLGIDFENISGKPGVFIDIEISENELKTISENNFKYKILVNDLSKFYSERYKASVKKHKGSLNGINYVTPVNFN